MSTLHVLSGIAPPNIDIVGKDYIFHIHTGRGGPLPPVSAARFLAAADDDEAVPVMKVLYPGVKVDVVGHAHPPLASALATHEGGTFVLHEVPPPSLNEWLGLWHSQPSLLKDDVVGLTAICERLGGAVQMTAYKWTYRDDFPKPITEPGVRRQWRWLDVEKWALRNCPMFDDRGKLISGLPALRPWAFDRKKKVASDAV